MTSRFWDKTWLLESVLVIAWSSGFIGARLAADTSSVFLVLFWRFVIVAVVLAGFVFIAMRGRLTIRAVAFQALLGGFAMFGYLGFGVKSIAMGVPIGTAALIAAIQPMATAALAGPLLGEMVRMRQWAGLLLGFVGVSVAVGGSLGSAPLVAYGFSFAAMISLVIATLVAKAVASSISLIPAIGIQSAAAAALFSPLAAMEGSLAPPLDIGFVTAVAWFVVFSTFAGYGLYWLCLRRSTVTRVGSLIYLTPPVTMVWAWAMFGEPLQSTAIIGLMLCFLGVLLSRAPKEQRD